MQNLLELEVQRVEQNRRKFESKEESIERKIRLAEQARIEREEQVRKRLTDNFNRVAEQEAILSKQKYQKRQEKLRLEEEANQRKLEK